MVYGPGGVAPLDWAFMLGSFFWQPQNIALEIYIHGLSWWNKFLWHNAFSVKKRKKKQINIDLTLF
jgi:hypothetical protein